jgi:AcrR family transcriptional regulator
MDDFAAVRSIRKRRGQGASRQGEILAAAKRLFLTEGFERTTIRKIAAAVGVSAAALYLYFPDKDAILRAIAESTFDSLLACLEQTQTRAGTDLDRFRAGLAGYIAFGLAHPDEYRLTFLAKMMASCGPGRPSYPALPAAEHSFGILSDSIAGLMQTGEFAAADPLVTAEAVWACIHGATALLLDQSTHVKTEPGALIGATIEIIIRGLLCVE